MYVMHKNSPGNTARNGLIFGLAWTPIAIIIMGLLIGSTLSAQEEIEGKNNVGDIVTELEKHNADLEKQIQDLESRLTTQEDMEDQKPTQTKMEPESANDDKASNIEEIKKMVQQYDYKDLVRNIEAYEGHIVCYKGSVGNTSVNDDDFSIYTGRWDGFAGFYVEDEITVIVTV